MTRHVRFGTLANTPVGSHGVRLTSIADIERQRVEYSRGFAASEALRRASVASLISASDQAASKWPEAARYVGIGLSIECGVPINVRTIAQSARVAMLAGSLPIAGFVGSRLKREQRVSNI